MNLVWQAGSLPQFLMLILGLVGGIASGKSVVANVLRDMGAMVLDADQAGHFVLRDPKVIAELRTRWGDTILDSSGQISRRAVAKIVFAQGNEAERKFLEQLTHPRIWSGRWPEAGPRSNLPPARPRSFRLKRSGPARTS
ncbi:MAG: dephospho-CoA kinase [Planctomycetia bacterium]|nr:dephospho-CoA kinase [Planctomycetia bacterium]